ncbi:MAG: S41 family peptidase [Myxococcota bacterium]
MVWLLGILCGVAGPVTEEAQIERAAAFAKLYGYLRWFHPSDELQTVDLNALACGGMDGLASKREDWHAALQDLIRPVAPTVQLWLDDASGPSPIVTPIPPSRRSKPIAWRHLGLGRPEYPGPYWSARTGETTTLVRDGARRGVVQQSMPADSLRGRTVRLKARALLSPRSAGHLDLWLRADGPRRAFADTSKAPIVEPEWGEHTVTLSIPADAEQFTFGVMLDGQGTGAVDEVRLEVRKGQRWVSVSIVNGDFARGLRGWEEKGDGYAFEVRRAKGGRILELHREVRQVNPGLSHTAARPGDAVEVDLGAGLHARLPLALWTERGATLPKGHPSERWEARLRANPCRDPENAETRLAAVGVTWALFQHFFPYFEDVDVDWDAALSTALRETFKVDRGADLVPVLERLVAKTRDGHGRVQSSRFGRFGWLPLGLSLIEDQLVVTASETPKIQVGEVVTVIDGVPVAVALEDQRKTIAASDQLLKVSAASRLSRKPLGAKVPVELGNPPRTVVLEALRRSPPPPERPNVEVLDDGVVYLNLNRAPWTEVEAALPTLANAPGVVIDVRRYPTDAGYRLLPHLMDAPCHHDWMWLPEIHRPDRVDWGWTGLGWSIEPAEPHIQGAVVWLTTPFAISYAESVLGHVKAHDLGSVVGGPSAGTNGNVNPILVPGDYEIVWTGMRVTQHDGTRHFGVGTRPDVPVTPTLEAVRAGRDVYRDAALAEVRRRIAAP